MPTTSKTSSDYRDKLSKSSLTCQQLAERLVRSGVVSKDAMQEFWKKLTDERRKVVRRDREGGRLPRRRALGGVEERARRLEFGERARAVDEDLVFAGIDQFG